VKLEIGISGKNEAATLLQDQAAGNEAGLRDALRIVERHFDSAARPAFKAMVYCAIQDNIDSLNGKAGQTSCPAAP
jgi:hypothetical protein